MSEPIKISINAHVNSPLNWKAERMKAIDAMMGGSKIIWDIDLGLFSSLSQPLSNQTQFLSLTLSLEHFRDTLWKEFYEHTAGVYLYRGSANMTAQFVWDEEQNQNFSAWCIDHFQEITLIEKERVKPLYCRNVAAEYLQMLANRMPDAMPMIAQLDLADVKDLVMQVQLINPEIYGRVGVRIDHCGLLLNADAKIGICLPPIEMVRSSQFAGMENALEYFRNTQTLVKLIPEEVLISEWDGLDYLVFVPTGLSLQGKRKLQGFCAAGGVAITTQGKIGLSQELLLKEFKSSSY